MVLHLSSFVIRFFRYSAPSALLWSLCKSLSRLQFASSNFALCIRRWVWRFSRCLRTLFPSFSTLQHCFLAEHVYCVIPIIRGVKCRNSFLAFTLWILWSFPSCRRLRLSLWLSSWDLFGETLPLCSGVGDRHKAEGVGDRSKRIEG